MFGKFVFSSWRYISLQDIEKKIENKESGNGYFSLTIRLGNKVVTV